MKSVIITGSNRGIGLETALAYAGAGYKVFATMRDTESAEALLSKAKEGSQSISVHQMDVNSDQSVKQCIADILENHGPVDVLVNNAGIERRGSVEETDMSAFESVMNTNYLGAIRCAKALIPSMRKRRSGLIINISSVAGKIPTAPFGPYCASKFALEAISEAMAIELKPFNINVAIVEPGIIDTDMARGVRNGPDSIYPNGKRMGLIFSTSLQEPVHPSLVAEKILDIAESDSDQLRHPVGPDAIPFLEWRASMTDEQWVNWHSADEETWYQNMQNDLGMNVREPQSP